MKLKRFAGMLAMLCFALGTAWAGSKTFQAAPKPGQSIIEVVFVLDTTGSMGGMIQAAKDKVWSIVASLGSATPAPLIRVGLVAYRDRGDEYITKRVDLSTDVDAFYAVLMKLEANGGGDEPESINQALNEAVTLMSWSNSSDAYKVIFLVGDAPPHMDYKDDVKYPETCKLAQAAGVLINTIQCGNEADTVAPFQDIAGKSGGDYFQIEHEGGAVVIPTPYDGKIGALSREVNGTMFYYGDEETKTAAGIGIDSLNVVFALAPTSALADRADFDATVAGKERLRGTNELLYDIENNKVKLKDIPAKELPENMQKMTPNEREKYVKEQLAKRKALNEQLAVLSKQRQVFLQKEAAKTPAVQSSFDYQILKCIRQQAAKKKIKIKSSVTAPEKK